MAAMYEDIADWLVTEGLGVKGVDMFGGNMPGNPSVLIALFEQFNFESEMVMGGIDHDVLNLQIISRGASLDSTAPRLKLFTIRDRFIDFNNRSVAARTINGKLYLSIIPRSAPYGIGVDENSRQRWTCNFIVRKEP